MFPQPKKILKLGQGSLFIMSKPTGGEYLADDIRHLRSLGIDHVVSLLEPREASELGLAEEALWCERLDIDFHQFPVQDRAVPDSLNGFLESVVRSYAAARAGANLVAHCRAGIGRSGFYTTSMLVASGYSAEEAFSLVSEARGFTIPDTLVQIDWVMGNESAIRAAGGALDDIRRP